MCLARCLLVTSFFLLLFCADWLESRRRFFFFQAEDGIRDLVRSRGLGDVYKRQRLHGDGPEPDARARHATPAQPRRPARSQRLRLALSLIHI
mgnify:CR=1 FL=1